MVFETIKSKYILKVIFGYLLRKKYLGIIKYNKQIQKRVNLKVSDYKSYSDIEIEIIPVKNEGGKFININKEERIYYHIFFNDKEGEVKGTSLWKKNKKIKKIKIIIDYQVKSLKGLFNDCKCIESIYFNKSNRNNINNMKNMFSGCSSLKEINFSNLNTNNVNDMGYMFFNCSSIKEINLANFNTNKVEFMNYMFYGCSSLEKVNISSFNTQNVKYMNGMFLGCSSLKELNIANFNLNNIVDVDRMFLHCQEELKMKIRDQVKNIYYRALD